MNHRTWISVAAAALVLSAPTAHAAKGYVIQEEVSGIDGKTPKTKTTYVTESAIRTEEPDKTIILSLKGNGVAMHELHAEDKTANDMSQMAPMMMMGYLYFLDTDRSTGKPSIRKDAAVPTSETKAVGKYKATKVVTSFMGMKSDAWFSKDMPAMVEADHLRMGFFSKATAAFMAANGGDKNPNAAEMQKLVAEFNDRMEKGYGAAIATETHMGTMTFTTRVTGVEVKDLPGDLFTVPAGYKVEVGPAIPGHARKK